MNALIDPKRFFIPLFIFYLGCFIWNRFHGGTIPLEWFVSACLSVLGFGLVWSFLPSLIKGERPSMNEFVPVFLLFIFLWVLIQVGQKTGTISLIHTVLALLYFRTLLFQLKQFRRSPRTQTLFFVSLSLGLVLGFVSQLVLMLASFKGFSVQVLQFAELFAVKGALGWVILAMLYGSLKNRQPD